MRKNQSDFNELIVLGEKAKKKGGSMAAVFKLIQELLDFEEKIDECCNAQEMSDNRGKIEAFKAEIDKMYDVLFEMARGGISSIRDQRKGVIEAPEEGMLEEGGEEVEVELTEEPEMISDKRSTPIMLNVPQIPKM